MRADSHARSAKFNHLKTLTRQVLLKEYVVDSERKTKALTINEPMQDQVQIFSEDLVSMRKELTVLHTKRVSSETEFAAMFATADAKRSTLRTHLLSERMALKNLMTADEWAKVFAVSK